MDKKGKDTYRHKKAGAATVVLSSPTKVALLADAVQDLAVREITDRYIYDVDMIITEGFKGEQLPKIEVFPNKKGIEPVCLNDKSLIAIVTDEFIDAPVPQFLRNDIEGIAKFILRFVSESGAGRDTIRQD